MLITLKMILRTLILPPAGPLLLAALGLWLARWRTPRARRAGWLLVGAVLVTLWLLATPVVASALTRLVQRCPPLDLGKPVNAQAIVILGGGEARPFAPEYGGPAAGIELLDRLSYGAFVARRTGLPVLVSGSAEEALAMRVTLARDFSIRTRWVDGQSRDTFQNAAYSSRLLRADGVTRIILVTSGDHEWRALQEFASAGVGVVPAPTDLWAPRRRDLMQYLPGAVALWRSSEALYELLGNVARELFALTHLRRQGP
ncbi:MAG: YdcF family protein [Steroidobacteraceae bacterium]